VKPPAYNTKVTPREGCARDASRTDARRHEAIFTDNNRQSEW